MVVLRIGGTRSPARELWEDEPLFWPTHSYVTIPRESAQRGRLIGRLADYLAHRVTRFPGDLLSHGQRLLLHIHQRDGEAAYGAFLDLFIESGHGDPGYRRHLLTLAAGLLESRCLEALQERLDSGVKADDLMPLSRHSRLSRSVTGRERLVTAHADAARAVPRGTLAEARDLIDSGRLGEAREVLEHALLDDPDNEALGLELIELYQHTRDKNGLAVMQTRLAQRSPKAARTWAAIATLFSVGKD